MGLQPPPIKSAEVAGLQLSTNRRLTTGTGLHLPCCQPGHKVFLVDSFQRKPQLRDKNLESNTIFHRTLRFNSFLFAKLKNILLPSDTEDHTTRHTLYHTIRGVKSTVTIIRGAAGPGTEPRRLRRPLITDLKLVQV